MSRQKEESQQSSQTSANNPQDNFNFDQWAGAVKRQMIASLKRRGAV